MEGAEALNDDDESSSSTLSFGNDFKNALEEFREKWQSELKSSDGSSTPQKVRSLTPSSRKASKNDEKQELSTEEKAMAWFLQGVELEKKRKVFEAMQFYRKAVQLVPDIEYKFYEANQKQLIHTNMTVGDEKIYPEKADREVLEDEDEDDDNLENVDLIQRFQTKLSKSKKMFERANAKDKLIIFTSAHFSDLPTEVILYILRWVVSSDLDIKSLERFSAVCRGFYLLARDPEIWRQVCLKVWGVHLGSLRFDSWRDMYINRSRVHFHGCYISRNSYMRYGEHSFQDQFYRPVQLVEYFRYFRFFPDGKILMLTSSEDPQTCVSKLKTRNPHQNEILKGHYRLIDDTVIIVVQRLRSAPIQGSSKRKVITEAPQTFYLEFNIASSGKKSFSQLHWKQYSLVQIRNQQEETTIFELAPHKFPPFYFSRVKSYHLQSDEPI